MGLGEGTQRGAACEMRVLKSLSGKRRGPWGRCLIFSLFLKVTHVTFYLCQLIEQRSLLITSGTREEQAGMLSTELTALDVTELWRWETRAGSEHELATFLLPKPHGLVTRRADVQHPHSPAGGLVFCCLFLMAAAAHGSFADTLRCPGSCRTEVLAAPASCNQFQPQP